MLLEERDDPFKIELGLQLVLLSNDMKKQEWVGDQYLKGKLVARDVDKAIAAYYLSSKNGNFELCRMFADHLFNNEQFVDSLKFYEILAHNGDGVAQYTLGLLYEGLGGTVDLERAYYNYSRAANNGIREAELRRKYLKGRIDWQKFQTLCESEYTED